MQQLTNAEEQVMEHLLKLEKAFMKDLLEAYQNQTCNHNHRYFIKKNDRQALAYNEFGNSGILSFGQETDYFSKHVND
jgi:hypothetical protein